MEHSRLFIQLLKNVDPGGNNTDIKSTLKVHNPRVIINIVGM